MNEFFATLYEQFYYSSSFSGDLYTEGLYSPLGLSLLVISVFFVVLFYYIINRPLFSKWYHWLTILLINLVIHFGLGVFIPQNRFEPLGLSYGGEYYVFGFMNAIMATLAFVLFSFGLRWWSTNCKRTPIPH